MMPNKKEIEDLFKTRIDELGAYLKALKNNNDVPEKKFFIFAHYRTGSTLLKSLIDSHPDIKCEGEIFLPFIFHRIKKVFLPKLFIKERLINCYEKNYGFVLRLNQLEHILTRFHVTPSKFVEDLYDSGWKIIHLKRENYLRQAISNIIQLKRGQSHSTTENPVNKTIVNISLAELLKSIEWMENYSIKEDEIIKKTDHMKIIYENDLLDSTKHQITSNRIFNFLDINESKVKTAYRKVSSDNIGEHIENFDELKNFIRKTRYSKFLVD